LPLDKIILTDKSGHSFTPAYLGGRRDKLDEFGLGSVADLDEQKGMKGFSESLFKDGKVAEMTSVLFLPSKNGAPAALHLEGTPTADSSHSAEQILHLGFAVGRDGLPLKLQLGNSNSIEISVAQGELDKSPSRNASFPGSGAGASESMPGETTGVVGGVSEGRRSGHHVRTAAPPVSAAPAQRIRVNGQSQMANLIEGTNVQPVYPPLARQARIQGSVVFAAIISKKGTVSSLNLIRGHPLLVNAASEAAKNWRFRPTLLNGKPTEVDTTIEVSFSLK
jgi:TonB family protein